MPAPHHEMLSPAIDGAVHRNGQPVAGARLYVENGERCTYRGKALAQSDAGGMFHIPERQVMSYLLGVVMDPMPGRAGWRLCIADAGQQYEAWYEKVGMFSDRISLDCNLESATHAWVWRSMYYTHRVGGICRSLKDEAAGILEPAPTVPEGGRAKDN